MLQQQTQSPRLVYYDKHKHHKQQQQQQVDKQQPTNMSWVAPRPGTDRRCWRYAG